MPRDLHIEECHRDQIFRCERVAMANSITTARKRVESSPGEAGRGIEVSVDQLDPDVVEELRYIPGEAERLNLCHFTNSARLHRHPDRHDPPDVATLRLRFFRFVVHYW